MDEQLMERLRSEIDNLEDAFNFRLRTHEKIVPMGAGEVARLIATLRRVVMQLRGEP